MYSLPKALRVLDADLAAPKGTPGVWEYYANRGVGAGVDEMWFHEMVASWLFDTNCYELREICASNPV
jgi:hypothetical protein